MQDDITGMTSEQLRSMLKLAEAVAREAGELLKEAALSRVWSSVAFESRRDIKLEADQRSEAYIVEHLVAGSPYGVLGEEGGRQGPMFDSDEDVYWVVDPLDGTVNYMQGIPLCCCSIALMKGKEPVLGAIYNFNNNQMFCGAIGVGCLLDGLPVQVSKTVQKESAILMTGLPAGRSFAEQDLVEFGLELGDWRKVRMIGSAALSLAYVASGRADAYWEQGIQLWDVAAGLALVRAAGGSVRIESERDYSNGSGSSDHWGLEVLATNGQSDELGKMTIS